MKQQKVIYTCNCGAIKSNNIGNPSYVCQLCGTPVNKVFGFGQIPSTIQNNVQYYHKTIIQSGYYDISKYAVESVIDISAKYEQEISKINAMIPKYNMVLNERIANICSIRNMEIDNITPEYSEKKTQLMMLMKQYDKECGRSLITGDASKLQPMIADINFLRNEVQKIEKRINAIREKHNRIASRVAAAAPEATIITQLSDMRNSYAERIYKDWDVYGAWITLVYLTCYIEDPSYIRDFITESDSITDEDDEYLRSICDEYEGKAYYIKKVNREIKREKMRSELYKKSRARSVVLDNSSIFEAYPMMDIDPWGAEASNACFESYMKDIASHDGSIGGLKL